MITVNLVHSIYNDMEVELIDTTKSHWKVRCVKNGDIFSIHPSHLSMVDLYQIPDIDQIIDILTAKMDEMNMEALEQAQYQYLAGQRVMLRMIRDGSVKEFLED